MGSVSTISETEGAASDLVQGWAGKLVQKEVRHWRSSAALWMRPVSKVVEDEVGILIFGKRRLIPARSCGDALFYRICPSLDVQSISHRYMAGEWSSE